ncbi:MAG: ATP-binding protein [Mycoplasmoidaceae bacterium]
MKANFKEFLPEILKDKKIGEVTLSKSEINFYKDHELFKELHLIEQEILNNSISLKKIIAENEGCKNVKNKCFSISKYHMGIKREDQKLIFYAYYCPKMEALDQKYYFKKNYLYNYYADSDISNTLLNKEYFSKSDRSLQVIVDIYKKNRDISNSHGLYIYGNFGVGKTHLSYAFANDLIIKNNIKVCFVFLPEYINLIKKSFNNDDYKEYVDRITNVFKEVDVLFFDDIGAEYSSEWFYIEYFLNILNQRMNNHKTTFFNSNLSLDQLEENFKYKFKDPNSKTAVLRLMDRIRTLVNNEEYKLIGENKRYKKN